MSYLGQQLGQGQAERFVFTASGGETSVTTSDDGRAVAYTVGQVDVYLNGAKLINGSDFTATTGTSITGLAALTASDVVEVFALSIFQASDTVSAASGGTFNGNITIDANLSVTGTADIDTSLNVDGTVTADGASVTGSVAGDYVAAFENTNATNGYGVLAKTAHTGTSAYAFGAYASSTALMVVRGDGNVGIGTTSPSSKLSVASNTTSTIGFDWTGDNTAKASISTNFSTGEVRHFAFTNYFPTFYSNNTERARIDSSGNLLVGKTSVDNTTAGGDIYAGLGSFVKDGSRVLTLARKTSDGDIVEFRKDTTTVGSIGVSGGNNIYISGTVASHSGLTFATGEILPTAEGVITNGQESLGSSSNRFKDLYLSGGVYLGGTAAVNLLDDYEEGTWTPGNISGGTVYNAIYTRIGRTVTIAVYLDGVTFTDNNLTGLPFSTNSTYHALAITYNNSSNLDGIYAVNNLMYFRSGASATVPDGSSLMIAGTYQISGA